MKVLNKLSLKNLLLNKKRSVGTLIGIALSVALICAVAGMFIGLQDALVQTTIQSQGNYHIELFNQTDDDIKVLENNRDIEEIEVLTDAGYSEFDMPTEERPYIHLYSYDDEKSFANLTVDLLDGDYPKNSNEILISEELYLLDKDKYNIGKEITLNYGERKTLDGYTMTKENPYNEDEVITNSTEETFTIVGIMDRDYGLDPHGDPGIGCLTVDLENSINNNQSVYIRIKNPASYEKTFSEILGTTFTNDSPTATEEYSINASLLRWQALKFDSSTTTMIYSIMSVLLVIIVGTSIFCIKNSFDISVMEKKKNYGMLASAGATKKQIKKNVITEGLMLGIIGIPVGIIVGYIAVFILTIIVNGVIGDFITRNVEMRCIISWLPILVSIILGVVTIYFSSIRAAKKASKVSPIDLIRSNDDVKINKNKLKTPSIIKKVFGIGGVIAYKNLKRSKKKYRTTVISLAVSVFVFISMNTFMYYTFSVTNTYYNNIDYNIMVTSSFEDSPKLEDVLKVKGTDDYTMLYQSSLTTDGYLEIDDLSKLTDFGKNILEEGLREQGCYDERKDIFDMNCDKKRKMNIIGMDEKSFKEYVDKLGLDYNSVKNKGVLVNNYSYINAEGVRMEKGIYNYKKNDTIKGTYNGSPLEIDVSEVTNVRPSGLENFWDSGGYLIVSEEEYHDLDFRPYILTIQADNPTQVTLDIDEELPELSAVNIEENAQAEKSLYLLMAIFLYGFIAVITLIGVTNIFNTITSNLELRQKEFAMLKSVGMTRKEFNRMINLETIFYSIKALIYGVALGSIGSYLVYLATASKLDYGYHFPLSATIISIVAVFVLVYIIMRYSMNKINKQNIIETIRKDNI
ncbi:MAG TPA: ABC transporter permease [Candidatus Faecimonas intestinavium]|nr:ABC transporter permease [Candidatus Faecimonas intestinavium]